MKERLKSVEIESYNPFWPEMFVQESLAIKMVLGRNCISIEHIGSTAVSGLLAKPKIDIGIEVHDLIKVIKPLETLGYICNGEWNVPVHLGFSKRGEKSFNLHIYHESAPSLQAQISFRDSLRNNSSLVLEYAALKQKLVAQEESHQKPGASMYRGYTLGKNNFIKKVLRQGRFDNSFIQFCVYQEELSRAMEILQKNKMSVQSQDLNSSKDYARIVFYSQLEIVGFCSIKIDGSVMQKDLLLIDHQDTEMASALMVEFAKQVQSWMVFKRALNSV